MISRATKAAAASAGNCMPVSNPATNSVIGNVLVHDRHKTLEALQEAQAQQKKWAMRNPRDRGAVLSRLYSLFGEREQELASILQQEGGKTLADATAEVRYSASFMKFYSETAIHNAGEMLSSPVNTQRSFVVHQPIGVVGAITPWNFPLAMPARKLAPALAAGCAVVLKPSELTPLSSLALHELALEAGVPPGLFSVVNGDPVEIADTLTASPIVRLLTFTGSTRVGRILMRQSAPTLKKLSLELGGNAPFIVFDDANVPTAVEQLLAAKLRSNGQVCIAPNRIMLHRMVEKEFKELLVQRIQQIAYGDPALPNVQVGPLISSTAVAKAQSHVDDALSKGASIIGQSTGDLLSGPDGVAEENFFAPTVIANVDESMLCMKEESFAPLFSVSTFDSEEEAIAIANNTEAGLAAYVYSQNSARLWRLSERIEAGMVGANTTSIGSDTAPFGGVKQSGVGRESGRFGLEECQELKYIALDIAG